MTVHHTTINGEPAIVHVIDDPHVDLELTEAQAAEHQARLKAWYEEARNHAPGSMVIVHTRVRPPCSSRVVNGRTFIGPCRCAGCHAFKREAFAGRLRNRIAQ